MAGHASVTGGVNDGHEKRVDWGGQVTGRWVGRYLVGHRRAELEPQRREDLVDAGDLVELGMFVDLHLSVPPLLEALVPPPRGGRERRVVLRRAQALAGLAGPAHVFARRVEPVDPFRVDKVLRRQRALTTHTKVVAVGAVGRVRHAALESGAWEKRTMQCSVMCAPSSPSTNARGTSPR